MRDDHTMKKCRINIGNGHQIHKVRAVSDSTYSTIKENEYFHDNEHVFGSKE